MPATLTASIAAASETVIFCLVPIGIHMSPYGLRMLRHET